MKVRPQAWYNLVAVFLVSAAGATGVSSLPLLNAALRENFHWSHAEIARAPSLLFLLVAIFAPVTGYLLDRFSPRRLVQIGSVGLVLSLIGYGFVDSLARFTAFYIFFAVFHTFTGIVPGVYILSRWFKEQLGLVIGIFLVGSSFSGMVFPQLLGWLLSKYEPSHAAFGLALAVGVFCLPSIGLCDKQKLESPSAQASVISDGPGFGGVLCSPQFYLLLFVTASLWFCILALVQHLGFFMKDLQLEERSSANLLSLFFFCSIIGKILLGYLADRLGKRKIMTAAIFLLLTGAMLLSAQAAGIGDWLLWAIIIFGIGYSGTFTMIQLVVAEFYRGPSYGKILGLVTTVDTLAGSLGVLILGEIRTIYGAYLPAFVLMAGLCLASFFLSFRLRKPDDG